MTKIFAFILSSFVLFGLSGCIQGEMGGTDEDSPDLATYMFEVNDHSGAVSSESNDKLVDVLYKGGDPLSISSDIRVDLIVDGFSMEVCQHSAAGDGSDVDGPKCYFSHSNDLWEVGEVITIGEVETNYCETSCNIQVDIRSSGEDEAIFGTAQGVAE